MDSEKFFMRLKEKAQDLGFAQIATIPVVLMDQELSRLRHCLDSFYNGNMSYLERNHTIRRDPSLLLEGAKSIIVTLISYKPEKKQTLGKPGIATYAYGKDYHQVVKERLRKLAEIMLDLDRNLKFRVFTDSAPIFERSLAAKAGLGFVGKNSFLINKEHGLHTFIGSIVTDAKLYYTNPKEPLENLCGSCTRCIDACPAGAIIAPYTIDARRCISYQTIEDKSLYENSGGSVHRSGMVFGCDICLDACPWSKKGKTHSIKEFDPLVLSNGKYVTEIDWDEWMDMDELFFKKEFKESPLSRAGMKKIKNNIKYEMANNCRGRGVDPEN